ncbi:RNA polymerase sigma factor [Labilibacter marinus]|uniref:RNA polymerase sigma factor n=1 Tax=Labilibacter marinus TaxID=1477105 RepID=UPI000829971D|nr:RNA polymerase sigma-70 factor [Labilibacter marinus]
MTQDKLQIDPSLIAALKNGDEDAFKGIYELLYARLFRFVKYALSNSEDSEEIVQETFLKLWKSHQDIDLDKSFESFVFTIAKNQIKDFLRKVLSQKKYIESIILENSFESNQLEEIVNYRETDKVIRQLIGMLPEKRRTAFELSRFQGKTYKEISLLMNISENTVDTHIRKALGFLKEGFVRFSSFIFCL